MKKYGVALLMIAYFMLGCNNVGSKSDKKVGFVVTPNKHDIYYKCGNKEANLDKNGKFICESFPIAFFMDGNKIGTISTIHNDGYVFPQDMETITLASR